MEQLIVIAIAALVAVVVLALFGKGIRIFGLRISWRDGMTVNFERSEDKEFERKKVSPKLDELQDPWDRTDVSSLPVQKDPPPNKLAGKKFMDEDYTSSLIASLEENVQGGDYLYFDDGTSQESEDR
jgi:hypothetical protein